MRRGVVLWAAVALSLGSARAQVFMAPPVPAGAYATAAQVQALATAAPAPCAGVPAPDTLVGGVGTASPCLTRPDASRATVVQAANVVTDASGAWAVTWARPFASAQPAVNPLPVNVGTLPIICNVQVRSTTMASGKCWQASTSTLPGSLTALAGLVVNAFTSGAANTSVMVIAREPTQ